MNQLIEITYSTLRRPIGRHTDADSVSNARIRNFRSNIFPVVLSVFPRMFLAYIDGDYVNGASVLDQVIDLKLNGWTSDLNCMRYVFQRTFD